VCFFVLCKRHSINRVPGSHHGPRGFPVTVYSSHLSSSDAAVTRKPRAVTTLKNLNLARLSLSLTVCVSLFYVNDTRSIGSRGRTVGIPYIYPPPVTLRLGLGTKHRTRKTVTVTLRFTVTGTQAPAPGRRGAAQAAAAAAAAAPSLSGRAPLRTNCCSVIRCH